MATEIKVPDMGESVIEATVIRWLKEEGQPVKSGEPVVELETDKINLEVGAQQAGILNIERKVGDQVVVGDVLGRVTPQPEGEEAVEEAPKGASAPDDVGRSATPVDGTPTQTPQPSVERQAQESAGEQDAARATPLAQRMAKEQGVDLNQIKPSSGGARITKEDVQAFLEKPHETEPAHRAEGSPTPQTPSGTARSEDGKDTGRETRQRMSRRRQTIARRLVEAQQTAAMLTTFNEIDMTRVMALRKRQREGFKERFGVDLGFMGFFIKAVVGALKAFPRINAEIQGDEIVLKHYYDIGIAVGAEEGLVVPVIRDADRLSYAEIETAIRGFVEKAQNNTLTLDDLRGGTFTITNGGVYGSLLSTPILNPPQVGILGMHRIQERPVGVNGEIVLRPMMNVALSYDHRIVDGREAVQFLVRVKEQVEDPESMLLS